MRCYWSRFQNVVLLSLNAEVVPLGKADCLIIAVQHFSWNLLVILLSNLYMTV